MHRPRTKPQTGKRLRKSAGRLHCRNNPGDPSCYYPGKNNQFVNDITGQVIDSGCIGGNRNAPGNPRDCDFRKVRFKGPNPTQLADLTDALSHFNRARIQYADSQALIKKYSPFRLDASGWPDIPALTENQCQDATNALIDSLATKIKPELWAAGARIWVSERGDRRLKCTRKMPGLRYPPGMAGRNRYFQMGISYAYTAVEHLWEAFARVYNNNLAGFIDADEAAAVTYVLQNGLAVGSPIRQWRNALKLLKVRHKKASEAAAAAEIQEAAAAHVFAAPPPVDQEILDLLGAMNEAEVAQLVGGLGQP